MIEPIGSISARVVTILSGVFERLEEWHDAKEKQHEWNRFLKKELKYN